MSTDLIVVLVVLGLLAFVVIGIFNKLVRLRNQVDNAFAQIDVQLQRRYDLIPNLVEVAKTYMAHERETLEAVLQARNGAKAAADQAKASGDTGALAAAEATLGGAMMQLHAVAEAYPDLKADKQLSELNEELSTTENRIGFARQAFNDGVTVYNTAQQVFPAVLFASAFGHKARDEWVVEDKEAKKAVKVSFD